ncbi:WSC domain-containing protein [Panaeolus papilionaceus]|nr:WSC domain-containing protein [Panaeolus papilionaceus]
MSFARLTTLLAILPLALALPGKRQVDNGPLPGWTFVGCFTDVASSRTLLETTTVDPIEMTPNHCTAFCQGTGTSALDSQFTFAGTEFTSECFCDFNIQGTATQVDDSECDFACAGDPTLTCGGFGRVSIYTNGGALPDNKATVGDWAFSGCHTDAVGTNGRTLLERFDIPGGVTIESCTAKCLATDFTLSGLEFGQECWCGDALLFEDTEAPLGECSQACKADPTELCGASSRLSLYTLTA